jgi:hypothetical protein
MRKDSIRIRLSEVEVDHLKQMIEGDGCGVSEFVRRLISAKWEKLNPAYKVAGKIVVNSGPKLTPEQQCEAQGGKVQLGTEFNLAGKRVCFFKSEGLDVPLTDPMFNQ